MIASLLKRASIDNPSTPLSDPDVWLTDALGGGVSKSGIEINTRTALTYAPVWRAVSLISFDVAKLPLQVFKREGDNKVKATNETIYQLLRYRPNALMTAFNFWSAIMKDVLLRGNGYAWISRSNAGQVLELIPLDAGQTWPVLANGELQYVTSVNGTQRRMDPADILHFRGLGDGLEGLSVISFAKDSLGLGLGAMQYGSTFFRNGAKAGVLLIHPNTLTDKAKKTLKNSWDAMHRGIDNNERTAVLEEGMKVERMTTTNDEAQFIETRQFSIKEVANWFGLPPHKLGDDAKSSFASLEQENQSYLDGSLDPWLVNIEQESRVKLLTQQQQSSDSHTIEFNREALIRVNMTDKVNSINTAIMGGWMSRDEGRAKLNMNPIPGGAGEVFLQPLNMTVAGEQPDEPEPNGDNSRYRPLVEDVCRRMIRRLGVHARKAARDPDDFCEWIDGTMWDEHGTVVREAVGSVADAIGFDGGELAESLRVGVVDMLNEAAQSLPAKLAATVDSRMNIVERDLPTTLADLVLALEVSDGT